jgi:Domain of unknown function (DUF5745)
MQGVMRRSTPSAHTSFVSYCCLHQFAQRTQHCGRVVNSKLGYKPQNGSLPFAIFAKRSMANPGERAAAELPAESSPGARTSSSISSAMSAHEEEQLILAGINKLLERVGIDAKPIKSFEELRKSASSMFVAIFEGMFQVRKEDIVRKPTVLNDYARNAQVVIDALDGEILHMNLDHVTGHAVAKGETVAIRNLVDIFIGISDMVIKLRSREQERGSVDSSPVERPRGKKPVPRGARPKSAPVGTVNASSSAAARGNRKNTARGSRSYPTSTVRNANSTLRTKDGRRSSKDASKRPAKKVRKKYPRQPMLSQALLELEARKLQEYDNEQQQKQQQQQQQQQSQQQAGGDDDASGEQPSVVAYDEVVYDEIPAEVRLVIHHILQNSSLLMACRCTD